MPRGAAGGRIAGATGRDADHGARIWHDNGVSVTALARLAGVAVTYAHCDLTTLETEYRRVEPVQAKGDRGE